MFLSNQEQYLSILQNYGLPTNNSSFWWVRYPKRACQEIQKLQNGTNAEVFFNGDTLVWMEAITNDFGSKFVIAIETSNNYPFQMPKIHIVESDIDYNRGQHVYPDLSLCVMHPNVYSSDKSILEFRNAACVWVWAIEVFIMTGEWPTDEYEHERR